jgi:BirA family biotin operon repressor/biotin-[acetyl-CoA-carboxylase] ligase
MTAVMSSAFDVSTFLRELRDQPSAIGEPFQYFTSTTSTNDEAKLAARAGAPSGACFLADHQTAGRGRNGRSWHAEPQQQLLVSVLWRPKRGLTNAALTLVVGVCLHRALCRLLPPPSVLAIKWPNDLESERRKLGGILVEGGQMPDQSPYVIIGFGLNVRPVTTEIAVPHLPTSLAELGLTTEREPLLAHLLRELGDGITRFERTGPDEFTTYLYRHNALADEWVTVENVCGKVVGIAANGALTLQNEAGLVEVTSGTVERIQTDV